MKKFMAAAAGALLIAGQVTSAMAATSDAVAATAPNARVVASSHCGAQSQHQMKMHAAADRTRTHLANRCQFEGMGGTGFLFAGLIAIGVVAVAVATNNKNNNTVSP
jgi:hypothetical protein